jgi:LmbE family N-acetylglucosaminyl deacetylase
MLILHAAPHPDDELIGAPATLLALRDAGHDVVNLAWTLGSDEGAAARRRAELEEACRRARFELVVPGADGPEAALSELLATRPFELVVGPSPAERHPRHELVAAAVRAALEGGAGPARWWRWGLWGELPEPTTIVAFGDERLEEILHALSAHESQLARNDYRRLVTGRAMTAAVLGPELVFGFGAQGLGAPYAELTSELVREDGKWRPGAPRVLDPADPFAGG